MLLLNVSCIQLLEIKCHAIAFPLYHYPVLHYSQLPIFQTYYLSSDLLCHFSSFDNNKGYNIFLVNMTPTVCVELISGNWLISRATCTLLYCKARCMCFCLPSSSLSSCMSSLRGLTPPIRVRPGRFMSPTVSPSMATTYHSALLTTESSPPRYEMLKPALEFSLCYCHCRVDAL